MIIIIIIIIIILLYIYIYTYICVCVTFGFRVVYDIALLTLVDSWSSLGFSLATSANRAFLSRKDLKAFHNLGALGVLTSNCQFSVS